MVDRLSGDRVTPCVLAAWPFLLVLACSDSKPSPHALTNGGVAGNGGLAAAGSSMGGGTTSAGASAGGQSTAGGEAAGGDTSPVRPVRLRTELRTAPLAIQTATPRLRWELESSAVEARGLAQAGYELVVGSSRASVAAGEGDLFASGQVDGKDPSLLYSGKPLHSTQRVYWNVRVRDQAGQLSAWSDVAEFTVGLLAAADWGAQWIGGSSAVMPIFRREFAVSKPVERALLSVCGLGQYEARVNGANVSDAVMDPSWTNYGKTCQYVSYDVTQALTSG